MTGEASVRADLLLVRRGLAASRDRARNMITGGLVHVDGTLMTRPARRLAANADITVTAPDMPWVSRAALKLLGGLDAFPEIDPSGLHCVDIGASTGGFTEVLLVRGAAHVVAVDVGHGQIHPGLADDPRVDSREGVNARDLVAADFATPPELIVCDASFISLTKVLPAVMRNAAPGAGLLALVKPQFEVGRAAIGKGGVVRDDRAVRDAVAMVENWLVADMGWQLIGTAPSPIYGQDGNREFLLAGRNP
ncbi:MAG: TlyA family RNA methyltransferase [Pseudomonadota bacterium]|nr:TlyA family RNA methyltransferase [Pseudomonadota bacterium]